MIYARLSSGGRVHVEADQGTGFNGHVLSPLGSVGEREHGVAPPVNSILKLDPVQ